MLRLFDFKNILLGTVAYTSVTFPIAVLWHIIIFDAAYKTFNYIEGKPSFLLGFMTIFIQGFVLSALYPYVKLSGKPVLRGLKYSLVLGLFFWTSHVLAFVAKQNVQNAFSFIFLESIYLIFQFGIYGVLIGLIYRKIDHVLS
jgi:hypothetical protein